MRFSIKVDGYLEMQRKLSGNALYAGPMKTAVRESVELAEGKVKERAPVMTNRLESSVTHRLAENPTAFWGVVTAGAENKGWRYPWSLNAGKGKAGSVTHYRSGPRQGKSTKKWFGGTIGLVRRAIKLKLNHAAREIERNWAR